MDAFESAEEFVRRLDAGKFDGRALRDAVHTLTNHQLKEVTRILLDRSGTAGSEAVNAPLLHTH
jgi:hypothetical protein